jgi:NADH-quinone oxidoreductase subunit E
MEVALLNEKYRTEVGTLLAESPADRKRAALMPLLYLAQKEYGYISLDALTEIGELVGLNPAEVASLAGFYTLYHQHPGGKRRVQICTDLPCALRGADQFAADLCANLQIKLGETTPDGEFTVEAVTCLAGCKNAPLFQVQTAEGIHYYEGTSDTPLTVTQALNILEGLKGK